MKSRRRINSENQPLSKRRLKTKPVLTLLAILFVGNIFWFVLWIISLVGNEEEASDNSKIVASIGNEKITHQEWMAEMERQAGKEVLQQMINYKVMEKAAEEYEISVTDVEIDLEISLILSSDDVDSSFRRLGEEELRDQIKSQLILEKVLTKDIVIKEKELKKYYEENESLYNIPTTYRTSLIVVDTKSEAEKVMKEIKSGSDFAVLAREKSIDRLSASLGGDIGYVTENHTNIDPAILKTVQKMKKGELSSPILLNNGRYGVVMLNEKKKGKHFTYGEVKEHIKRVIAMEQLPTSITPEAFWKEFNASWSYGE